jgi:simple sugar transport system permease protein
MFNIGGQGQYFIGLVVANWIGISLAGLNSFPHILLAIAAATLAGAVWAGIAGVLKATTGAHEVISTIMLNWIAYYLASWLFGVGGPLHNTDPTQVTSPVSNPILESAKLPVIWGSSTLQGLSAGFLIAIAALVVYWALINRTTLGYEVRAVGFNPDAAAYGGINVKKNIIRAMAISGAFAGLAGGIDMLGYLFKYGQLDVQVSQVGFIGIAVALLGRNTALGVFLGAFIFGGLLYGTTQGLTSNVIQPELSQQLTYIIQGLVVLFIGADILILYVWNSRKRLRRKPPAKSTKAAQAPA